MDNKVRVYIDLEERERLLCSKCKKFFEGCGYLNISLQPAVVEQVYCEKCGEFLAPS